MGPALRMTPSMKEKLPFFCVCIGGVLDEVVLLLLEFEFVSLRRYVRFFLPFW
jgi:hypothetical protein